MDYIVTLLFGVTQGITEFLPISSSGHLVVLHDILSLEQVSELSFDVALHFGTLVAVVVVFWSDLWNIVVGSFRPGHSRRRDDNRQLLLALIIGVIPAAFVGFFFNDIIEEALRRPEVVALMLVLVGIVFLLVEKMRRPQRDLSHVTIWDGVMIGLAQTLALIPGTSRSGITIAAGMARNLRREEAARFSFLLSVPIVAGAFVFQLLNLLSSGESIHTGIFAFGVLSSAIVGVFAIRFLLAFLARASLAFFAYYRFVLAALIVIWLVL